jgi:hypothetical protein
LNLTIRFYFKGYDQQRRPVSTGGIFKKYPRPQEPGLKVLKENILKLRNNEKAQSQGPCALRLVP